MTWVEASDNLNWSHGHSGKGYLLANGTVKTWVLDPFNPVDQQSVHQLHNEVSPITLNFDIDPDGGVVTDQPTPKVQEIIEADPGLYDAGQRPSFEDDWDLDKFEPKPREKERKPNYNMIMSAEIKDELHIGLDIPSGARKQIRAWVDKQDWPKGTELEDTSEYHITLLYAHDGHKEHHDADWINHAKGYEVEVTGIDEFEADDNKAIVLRISSPEVKERANSMQAEAESQGLEVSKFPGGYKPHLTIAYGPGKPKGNPPKFKFRTGPSSVSSPRTSSEALLPINMNEGCPKCGGSVDAEEGECLNCGYRIPYDGAEQLEGFDNLWDMAKQHYPDLVPVDMETWGPRHYGATAEASHFNRWTGKRCHCPWHSSRRQMQRTAGEHINRLRKAPDKAYKTPEGQDFLHRLLDHHPEHFESLFPYLAHRWKKGDIRATPHNSQSLDWDTYSGLFNGLGYDTLRKWHEWYEARQHPTRRGVNVMDPAFNTSAIEAHSNAHQQALADAEAKEESKQLGKTVHTFPNGWSIKNINHAQNDFGESNDVREAMEAEGEMMGHCFGSSNQPYVQNALDGQIYAYSLRDPRGTPHATWHYNSDGSLAEKFGANDSSLKPEYQDMLDEWGNKTGYDVDRGVGHQEQADDPEITLPAANDMRSYLDLHGDSGEWSEYIPDDANYGENTDINFETPEWENIAHSYFNPDNYQHHRQGLPALRDEVFHTALGQNHLGDLNTAIQEYDASDPHEQATKQEWDQKMRPYYHPYTGEFVNPRYMDKPIWEQYQEPLFTSPHQNYNFNTGEWSDVPGQSWQGLPMTSKWHFADYQGSSNWHTWNTKLMMDNDEPLYTAVRKLMERGATPDKIRDWALRKVIGPYNKERIQDAQEWNDIPQDERVDHHFEDLKNKSPEAADLVDGLGFGPDVDDDEPDLIDPELVNWDEIYQDLKDEIEENDNYGREMQEYQDKGIGWPTNHDEATNRMRDAMYRYHGAVPEEDLKAEGASYNDPRTYYNRKVHIPYEHAEGLNRQEWPERFISLDTRNKLSDLNWERGVDKARQELSQDPNYKDLDPVTFHEIAERQYKSIPYDERQKGKYDMNDPQVAQVMNADPGYQELQRNGYDESLSSHTWNLIHDIWNGRENPYIPQMHQALQQRGYTPEQIAQWTQQRWQWDPELNQTIPINRQPPVQQWQDTTQDEPGDLTIPQEWTSHTANSTDTTHRNLWTGKLCNCPWNGKHRAQRMRRFAGEHINKLRKAPDKAYKTEEGQEFLRRLLEHYPEEYESLFPYIAHRYKKGEIGVPELDQRPDAQGVYPLPNALPKANHLTWDSYNDLSEYQKMKALDPAARHPDAIDPEEWLKSQQGRWPQLALHQLRGWHEWYEARQHPTRRGVNVMDPHFSLQEIAWKSQAHQRALQEERERQRALKLGKTVHTFSGHPSGGINWDKAIEDFYGNYPARDPVHDDLQRLREEENRSKEMPEDPSVPRTEQFPEDYDTPDYYDSPEHYREDLDNLLQRVRDEYTVPGRKSGWHIRHLNAAQNDMGEYNNIEEAMEGEGHTMGHCIGSDEQPYKNCAVNGLIDAYSLRDHKNEPHVTWHYNSDGSLAEMFGPNDDPVKPEYQRMLNEWGAHMGRDTEAEAAVGMQEEAEDPYDEYFTFPAPTDVQDYLRNFGPDGPDYDYAHENGNIGDNTEFDFAQPDWEDVANDYLRYTPTGTEARDFHRALQNNSNSYARYGSHEGQMAAALRDTFDPEDSDHRDAINKWNENIRDYNNEIELLNVPVNQVDDYNEAMNEHGEAEPDDWDQLAQDYLQYPRHYGDPTPNPTPLDRSNLHWPNHGSNEYDQFHQHLTDNLHQDEMHQALQNNVDWDNPEHQSAIEYWNHANPQQNIHPPPPEQAQALPGQYQWHWPDFWLEDGHDVNWGGYQQEQLESGGLSTPIDPQSLAQRQRQGKRSDTQTMLSPAVELREWLADIGQEDPPLTLHHQDASDFLSEPPVTLREGNPMYPPGHVPDEYKQSAQRLSMAERSGFPELDQAIEEFMQTHPDLDSYRDPQNAWGQCEQLADECTAFLKQRGFKAYTASDDLQAFEGYGAAQDSAAIGAGDFSYPEHAVVEVYGLYGPNNVNNVYIDFTASQYGFTEFPKIHGGRLGAVKTADGTMQQADATNDPLGKPPAIEPSRKGDPQWLQDEFCPHCQRMHKADEPCPDSAVRQYQQQQRAWYRRDPNATHDPGPKGLEGQQSDLGKTADWDPMTCEHCGKPMGEPYQMGQRWLNTCTNCGLNKEVPEDYPLLQQHQNNWPDYPDLLDQVDPGNRPWVTAATLSSVKLTQLQAKYGKLLTAAGNQLWFKPNRGEPGRGFIHDPTNTVHTWPEAEGEHNQMAYAKGFVPHDCAKFYMNKEGVVVDLGGPHTMLNTIMQADPAIAKANGDWVTASSSNDPYDYLMQTLGLKEDPPYFIDAQGTKLRLRMEYDGEVMTVMEMLCIPQGTGLGTRVVEALQNFADETGQYLEVNDVQNPDFWNRFSIPQVDPNEYA